MLRILLNDGLDKKAISNLEFLGFDVDTNHYDIEDLKEKHRLEMEAKDKEYQHEKEMLELKSKVTIDEKNQEVMNSALSGIMGGIFSDVISGKISPEQINDLAKKFPKSNS